MPSGAVVRIAGRDQEFPVAERGEVYVTGLAGTNKLRASWRDQSCELEVDVKEGLPPLPTLGPFICTGVKR
jgi:outer membrane usher protein